ncbi:hypothetical protein ACFX2I_030006 [Malus domestica]
MDFASIQAQLANLTSQLSQYAERTTMQSVPTFEIGVIIQLLCGGNLNELNTKDIGSHMRSSIQNLCNMLNQTPGLQNQANEAQQDAYWQPYEEFYTTPIQPPQPPPQFSQTNSGTSMDNDQIVQLLTSLTQEAENQTKRMKNQANKMDELEKQVGQIVEIMAQIEEQSEFSNANIVNSMEDFAIVEAITLGSEMEDEVVPEPSKHRPKVDELLLQEEEEDDDMGSLEELLPFFIPKKEESEKDIVEALPKVQSDIQILGTANQVSDCVALFEELCTSKRKIQEKEVAGECPEFIKEDVFETTKPKEVEFDDTGQIATIVVDLAKFKVPETFKEVAPTLEFKSLPDHLKYHRPFKDQFHAMATNQV